MIDLFAIISLGGIVHWTFTSHKFDHLTLINTFLLILSNSSNDLGDLEEVSVGQNLVKWIINEDLKLIYLLAHPKMFPIEWSKSLLKRIDTLIISKKDSEALKTDPFFQLDEEFSIFFKEAMKMEESNKLKNQEQIAKDKYKNNKIKSKNVNKDKNNYKDEKIELQKRTWNDKATKSEIESLDFSLKHTMNSENSDSFTQNKDQSINNNLKSQIQIKTEISKLDELSDNESDSLENEHENEQINSEFTNTNAKTKNMNTWWNSLKSLTGNNPLTLEDLEPTLKVMKLHLISKNVASEPADLIVKAVGNQLENRIPGTFASISKMVNQATREIIEKILTPTKPNDLLNEIKLLDRNNSSGAFKRPFVMAFVGVNGVGKSTNLSKVAYWLLQHDLKVLMVAGDTFRAGAIEQLRQHSRNLGSMAPGKIEIYERGYGKDAALLTQEAIKFAGDKKFDVVLVDTAGRMQDNGPLMIALAKLISLNRPDRVIFVGEALVGHDALSQLSKFNVALLDHSAKAIDGILLTKVDTIDDKIGAALSMTLRAKAPILFMGVGQTYLDLRRVNIKQVVDLLLK